MARDVWARLVRSTVRGKAHIPDLDGLELDRHVDAGVLLHGEVLGSYFVGPSGWEIAADVLGHRLDDILLREVERAEREGTVGQIERAKMFRRIADSV